MTDRHTILPLQGVRAFAFLGIFLYHCGVFETGPWAVQVFLILSGFLMAYNYCDKMNGNYDFKFSMEFSIHKIKKLYPLHITMMLIVILPSVKEMVLSHKLYILYFEQILANLLLIQAWIPSNLFWYSLNGVAWYLSVVLFTYIVFPKLLCMMKKWILKNL